MRITFVPLKRCNFGKWQIIDFLPTPTVWPPHCLTLTRASCWRGEEDRHWQCCRYLDWKCHCWCLIHLKVWKYECNLVLFWVFLLFILWNVLTFNGRLIKYLKWENDPDLSYMMYSILILKIKIRADILCQKKQQFLQHPQKTAKSHC